LIVDSSLQVVTMTIGTSYLPHGCYAAGCAKLYNGGSVSMDQMVVTDTLLANLTWSDGQPLTSSDMLYSFNLNADPATPASKYETDRTSSFVTANPTQTLWTGLPGYFPYYYSDEFWMPLPEHFWGNLNPTQLITATVSSRTPMGWGAYVIDEWVSGDHISMHKNPLYFRAAEGLPHFDSLVVHFGTELTGILNGTCDVVVRSSDDLRSLLNYDNKGMLQVQTAFGSVHENLPHLGPAWEHLDFGIQSSDVYTGFAATTQAFQDVNVRRAVAYCIDRQAIADAIFFGHSQVANAFIPDANPYFPADATKYPYDPVQGKALLEAAGWIDSNGDGIREKGGVEFSITLQTTTYNFRTISAPMIAAQLAACGIQVTVKYPDNFWDPWPEGPLYGRNFDLAQYAWVNSIDPPCILYQTWWIPTDANPGGQNYPGYSNPAFDTACWNAMGSLREVDRIAHYNETVRIFTQDLPALPLFLMLKYVSLPRKSPVLRLILETVSSGT
jgi:peptide/nickel transport system substrate-binding protein